MSDLETLVDRAISYGPSRVYALGKVPASPVYPYVVMSLDTGRTTNRRGGGPGRKVRRLVVQMFGRSVDSVLAVAEQIDAAFEDAVIVELPDRPASRREVGANPYRDPDTGGVITALHTYTYD